MQPIFYMIFTYIRTMYLYNITIITEVDLAVEVTNQIKHLQDHHAKLSPNAPLHFLKMLDSPHDGETFCIQLQVQRREELESFQSASLMSWQQNLAQLHPGKVLFFESIMEYLND